MNPPEIRIVVRDFDSTVHKFKLQHDDVRTYQQARSITKYEYPKALCILVQVPEHTYHDPVPAVIYNPCGSLGEEC